MTSFDIALQWFFGCLLITSSLGVIFAKKPVHACLSFLVTLMMLAGLYLELSAQFIAVMQVLVYAGAILVLFMFVIILFQDAHQQIDKYRAKSNKPFLIIASALFVITFMFLGEQLLDVKSTTATLPAGYGTVESLGYALYLHFFFPFEAVIFVFLIALIGSIYIGRKVN